MSIGLYSEPSIICVLDASVRTTCDLCSEHRATFVFYDLNTLTEVGRTCIECKQDWKYETHMITNVDRNRNRWRGHNQ